ncbi:DNA-methyltransferase [Laedolimicola ammoniilytica]|uniref:Site-specific DNA-methyltransferase n=1 Tax=Laedolimicola ammoniilytica TaxID=2981771 RepID=A0ABT2RXB6_9FIRM|nr:site-specific DNA-methyltransferase [Laedolimicola ammoniilytica]MCU6696969.1 site-specific DNA-methyltransferase [Laedolimicola ammoniilytica]
MSAPSEYEESYYEKVSVIASLLEKEKKEEKVKKLKEEFKTQKGKLYHADCLEILPGIKSETVDLIFADPPFNLKKEYANGRSDNLSVSQYMEWSKKWLDECVRVLKPGGAIYIYNIPKWCIYYAEYLSSKLCFQNWIAIDMKNSFPIKDKYTPSHYGLLYFTKGKKPRIFNKQRLPIQTCRHCGGEYKDYGGYKDKMNPLGVNISDVWYDIFPVRKGKNRIYNELSVKLLDRVISFSSNEGDLILDPFGGSGTTFAVAELMNRNWIGIELGDCGVIKNRLTAPDKDEEILERIRRDKNVLFTKKSIKLRKKNGFWLPEVKE